MCTHCRQYEFVPDLFKRDTKYGLLDETPREAKSNATIPTNNERLLPKFINEAFDVPGYTLYVQIDIGNRYTRILPKTGIFFPQNFSTAEPIDLVIYLHGHKTNSGLYPRGDVDIEKYWDGRKYPFFALREEFNKSGRNNVILVAPTLGITSAAGTLVQKGGFDSYIGQVLAAINEYVIRKKFRQPGITIGNIILSAHSGGGFPMLQIARNNDRYAQKVTECWGFDSTYGCVENAWIQWSKKPSVNLFIYYRGSTQARAQCINKMAAGARRTNVCVQRSTAKSNLKNVDPHYFVPIAHLKERLVKSSCQYEKNYFNKINCPVPCVRKKPVQHEVFPGKDDEYLPNDYESNYDPEKESYDFEGPVKISQATPDSRLPDKPGWVIKGTRCKSGRKCWTEQGRSKDIIDDDIPWNTPDKRSPENYIRVIEYFNVGDSYKNSPTENPRYRRNPGQTWCNIYAHDVTRAMYANLPHWSNSPKGGYELNANATYDRLNKEWRNKIGWFVIDKGFTDWLQKCLQSRTIIPPPNSAITKGVINAAAKIISSPSLLPAFLSQPGYVAQQFANLGLPAFTIFKNLKKYETTNAKGEKVTRFRSGHVAVVRPETTVKACVRIKGKCLPPSNDNASGKFVPVTAQAGARNWENRQAVNMLMSDVLFFVHE